jgi:hypothetical protein
MRYMMIVKLTEDSEVRRNYEAGKPPSPELMEAVGKLCEKMTADAALLGTGGLLPLAKGARIRAANGKLSVTDGPFIESKEVIGGYAILRANSREEAIKMGQDFMQIHIDILGSGYEAEMEVREMSEAPEHSPQHVQCQTVTD